MYDSVALNTFTMLSSPHCYLILEIFHHPQAEPHLQEKSPSSPPPPQSLATTNLLSASVDSPILHIPYKCNYRVYGPWHLASCPQQVPLLFLSIGLGLHQGTILRMGLNSHSVQFSSVAQSCPTLCDPMNHSTPGLPVHHQLPESIQTHVHQVGDAIKPSHPLSSPSPPIFNLSQHQGLFHIRWPKYWSFSFNISLSNEHPEPIPLRMD